MLDSDHDTVRDWAAGALADLGTEAAIPALRKAYDRWRLSGTPPDWTEPENIRLAMTTLGARQEVPPFGRRENIKLRGSDRSPLVARRTSASDRGTSRRRADSDGRVAV